MAATVIAQDRVVEIRERFDHLLAVMDEAEAHGEISGVITADFDILLLDIATLPHADADSWSLADQILDKRAKLSSG